MLTTVVSAETSGALSTETAVLNSIYFLRHEQLAALQRLRLLALIQGVPLLHNVDLFLSQEIMIAVQNRDSVPRATRKLRNIQGLTPHSGFVFEPD